MLLYKWLGGAGTGVFHHLLSQTSAWVWYSGPWQSGRRYGPSCVGSSDREASLTRHDWKMHGHKHSEKKTETFHKARDSIRWCILGSFTKGTWGFKEFLSVIMVKRMWATQPSCTGGSVEVCNYSLKPHCITLFSCNIVIAEEHINYSHYGSKIRQRY